MRNPNGYGSVVFLGSKRRKPYAIRKTIQWILEDGRAVQKYKYVDYFATRQAALIALADLNKYKTDISKVDVPFSELYSEWYERHTAKKSVSSKNNLKYAIKYCDAIANKKIGNITEDDLQGCIDICDKGYQTKVIIKQILQGVMTFAVNRGIRYDNPSDMLDVGKPTTGSAHSAIKEVDVLLNDGDPSVMFLLYTGLRVQEMLNIKLSDVHLEDRYLVAGLKTDAGRDRKVPIHTALIPYITKALAENKMYLFEQKGKHIAYARYRATIWDAVMARYRLSYTPHDTRHTFITKMQKLNVPKICIQLIVGHKALNVTDSVYTHYQIEELIEFIDKLEY